MELGPWNKVDIIEISPFNEPVLLHVKINRNMVSYVYSFHIRKLKKKEKYRQKKSKIKKKERPVMMPVRKKYLCKSNRQDIAGLETRSSCCIMNRITSLIISCNGMRNLRYGYTYV